MQNLLSDGIFPTGIKAYDFDDERRKAMKEAEKNGKNIEAIIAETSAETPVNGSESDVKEVL